MNVLWLLLYLATLASYASCQYGFDPRIFFFPSKLIPITPANNGNNVIAPPFLIPGPTCTGVHLLSRMALSGTCQDYVSCIFKRRYIGGPCALGLKTCCIPKNTTNLITNPSTITPQTYEIHPYSNQYCQLRLDFDDLVIGDPVNGDCQPGEIFTVTGEQGPPNVPDLCGQIGVPGWDQHMYLEFQTSPKTKRPTPITLHITTSNQNSHWSIRATQIMCNDVANLAPSGCLQYYPQSSGDVRSFNYRVVTAPTMVNQLNNMNYKVCLDPGATQVEWTKDASQYAFSLTGPVSTSLGSVVNSPCTTDYVFIRDGKETSSGNNLLVERSCGTDFQTGIVSTASPLSLRYITDSLEPVTDQFNNGFHLKFVTV